MSFDPELHPHRRYDPLKGEWLLVSPQRALRPWQGQTETAQTDARPAHEPSCYLCPGTLRVGGAVNPLYTGTFVFDNDFPALLPDPPPAVAPVDDHSLFRVETVAGVCRVICFSPRHDLTLADLDPDARLAVVDTWANETAALGQSWRWVQLLENKGAAMGCSNPHPHGQVWASSALPSEALAEDRQQRAYLETHGAPLLVDYAARERQRGLRVVCENEAFLAVVPFWAVWPFEALVLPRRHVARLPELERGERVALAALLGELLGAYDRLFGVPFPYSMGWHGAPFDDEPREHWQVHAHIYPPLLRSATVKKFMVGYELLGEPQRDLTPEQAAARLRAVR